MPMVSKSRADKAGERLRRGLSDVDVSAEDLVPEFLLMAEWRAQHAVALTKTTLGLRSAVNTALSLPPSGRVVSRLKREEQIIKKLVRDRTRLSSMTDIAGCRAVLDRQSDVDRVLDRIEAGARKLEIVRVRDYVRQEEHPTGYRAVHILGRRDDYPVEIQLRTAAQHDWASRVERYDRTTGEDLKHGMADEQALTVVRRLSQTLAKLDDDG